MGTFIRKSVRSRPASEVKSGDGMGQRVALVDRDCVGHAVTRVENDAGGAAGGVEREHSLDGNLHCGRVERLEHGLCHLPTVGVRVERCLGKKHRVFLRRHMQLIVESVVPDLESNLLLHVVAVCHQVRSLITPGQLQ